MWAQIVHAIGTGTEYSMGRNEEHCQVEIAGELEESARLLANSTRDVPRPANFFLLCDSGGHRPSAHSSCPVSERR